MMAYFNGVYIPGTEKQCTGRQNKAVKAFNKLLKDKNIRTIKKESNGFYCITYADGAQFRCRGPVVDKSLIYTDE
jgi:hypothetical protein